MRWCAVKKLLTHSLTHYALVAGQRRMFQPVADTWYVVPDFGFRLQVLMTLCHTTLSVSVDYLIKEY